MVYIAWWLAKLGELTFKQFMHLYSVSRQNGKFVSSTMAGIIKGTTKVVDSLKVSVMGKGPKLSPYLNEPLKLPLSMEELFLNDAKVADFSNRVQKTSYGEMYLTLTSEAAKVAIIEA
ncbi:unnamed protein product, partial [Prunus brigantina]